MFDLATPPEFAAITVEIATLLLTSTVGRSRVGTTDEGMAMPGAQEHFDPEYIAEMVRYHRKAAGVSRLDLAALAGVGKTLIYDIEHGKGTVRMDRLAAVLRALNIRVQWTGPLMGTFEGLRVSDPADMGDDDA